MFDSYNPMLDPEIAHKSSVSRGRAVIGVDPQGVEHEWYGCNVAARELGVPSPTINQSCNGGGLANGVWHPCPHTKSKGKLKGWSFYWADKYVYTK